jgi:MFS family permease
MQRRLWVLIPLAGFSTSAIYGGVGAAVMAKQIAGFPSMTQAAAVGVLATIATIAAVSGVLSQPTFGWLSDRTRTRFLGRRNVWVLFGGVAGAVALVLTGLASNPIALGVAWVIAAWPVNAVQGITLATVPERVPIRIRARLTAVNGMASIVGISLGTIVGALLQVKVAYAALAVQLLVAGVLFALLTHDVTRDAPPRPDVPASRGARSRFPGFRSAPDFWWTFVGRFLAIGAYSVAGGLQLFALRDHFGLGTTEAASLAITRVATVSTLTLIVSAVVGGILADKFGRLKPFVIGASILFVPACAILTAVPTLTGAIAGFGVLGLGFGAYVSVDGTLVTRVIPHLEDAGRDLGILNIANAGPGLIAPAVAGVVISTLGYSAMYVVAAALAVFASVAVMFVRGVR